MLVLVLLVLLVGRSSGGWRAEARSSADTEKGARSAAPTLRVAPCAASTIPAWPSSSFGSKQRRQETAPQATRKASAEKPRAGAGQDRRSRWAWACVVVSGDTGGAGVLAESSRRYATFGAARRHKVVAGHACM